MNKPKRITKRAHITPELIDTVTKCAAAGCTFEQTAIIAGVEEDSLRRWMAPHFNKGKSQAIRNAGAVLYNLAVGNKGEGRKPNLMALMFYLKAAGGWRETTAIALEKPKEADNEAGIAAVLEARFRKLSAQQQQLKTVDATVS